MFVFIFFPPIPKPPLASMNWSSVIYGGVLIVSFVYFVFTARRRYVGPVEQVKKDVSG